MNDTQIPQAVLVARAPMPFKVSILKVVNGYVVSKDCDYPSNRSGDNTFVFLDKRGVLAQISSLMNA